MNYRTTTTYITYRELMARANKAASQTLKKNRELAEWAKRRQAFYDRGGHKVQIVIPKRLTWGEALSKELKKLYAEHFVVAELTEENLQHNAQYFEWVRTEEENMQRWQSQSRSNYTGD